ncbi:MAG: ribosomal-processing cysteine protease Prp [Oscillospiraceae bacterium]|nr:ribosomal-processing cysteine protease Prp [Oscillospiraceae bacterium]
MVRAVFERKNGTLCGFRISGHAGYADAGEDIVCAAVSSAVQYATILITEVFREKDTESAGDNVTAVRLLTPEQGQSARVLDGLLMHLQFLSEDYPGTIHITFTEVF